MFGLKQDLEPPDCGLVYLSRVRVFLHSGSPECDSPVFPPWASGRESSEELRGRSQPLRTPAASDLHCVYAVTSLDADR